MKQTYIAESPISKFLFFNSKSAWLWLVIRVYVGYEWFVAGYAKASDPAWVGASAGAPINGFLKGALAKTAGAHPDVQGWYAAFLQNFVVPHPHAWSLVVAYGELLVGVALIIGALTGIATFFGLFMNLNYLLAGTVSTNPILFTLSIGLILAWRISGYIGADYYLIPRFGTPWQRDVRSATGPVKS
ncbi:MAG: DoxX family protein [Candidatus Taylorbacteria bacterium RIFCSPHIGHO2_02_FULL_46_13]|uniref:DoxX family protein n=1 Tax=Candidatus Taylorbacteria bacterium RIFCSPHIGHO2_02_FULL_46_13 TaxID=1802312 RepID=A0A1G2MTQ5_9BACT|nr:MAG: DoxX family protein [Candidatus Taylorbacteria bacterium RIFCSPHIGHO2_02_FULL_46_13]